MRNLYKSIASTLCSVFAVVLLVLSINTFDLKTSITYEFEQYGGDAYTGIQNAAAATAIRTANVNNTIAYVGGSLLLMGSFAFLSVSVWMFAGCVKDGKARRNVSAGNLSMLAKQKEEQEENQKFWVCKCGMKNAEHTASCKGCGNSRTGAVVRGDGGEYKKCACGAMVKQGEKCPMCGKMVY